MLAMEPVAIPSIPSSLPLLAVTQEKFVTVCDNVIKFLEGGYYHPTMKAGFNKKSQKLLGDSGETLFGLDIKHGAALSRFAEWRQFWDLVHTDRIKNPGVWRYNYKPGGSLGATLRRLASIIMYKWYQYLAGKYILISSMDEIAADDRLIFHFAYASWNGEGWFQTFASALNEAVQKYEGNREMIYKKAISARTDSTNAVIRQQGANMLKAFAALNYK